MSTYIFRFKVEGSYATRTLDAIDEAEFLDKFKKQYGGKAKLIWSKKIK